MGKFLESEKQRLTEFKVTSPYFSDAARVDGVYKGKSRPFCVPRAHAEENLFPAIRQTITTYFAKYEIKWHDGQDRRPSNHLCDSQVCCANFLFLFADKPTDLASLLRPLFPDIQRMLPMEQEGQFVSIEWIGQDNYLNEKMPRHGKRTRGANFTSADAAVMFERKSGLKQIVLIEWKYTESYSSTSYKIAKSGTDRTAICAHLYDRDDFPLNKRLLPGFESLFYEPFYQLMRQQLLAHEMERTQELGADIVSLLHIAPTHNTNFQRVTSLALRANGDSVIEVWKKLVRQPDRFASISTEDMFGRSSVELSSDMAAWWKYIAARYPWVQE
jgi:hypothetical protein